MIFLKFDSEGNEILRHFQPHKLSKDVLKTGILVTHIPSPTATQRPELKYDGKKLYYEEFSKQEIEQRIAELINENITMSEYVLDVDYRLLLLEIGI